VYSGIRTGTTTAATEPAARRRCGARESPAQRPAPGVPRHFDFVAHPKLTFDRDQAREDTFAVLAFETPLLAKPGNLVTQAPNFLLQSWRPFVRNAAFTAGAGTGSTVCEARP